MCACVVVSLPVFQCLLFWTKLPLQSLVNLLVLAGRRSVVRLDIICYVLAIQLMKVPNHSYRKIESRSYICIESTQMCRPVQEDRGTETRKGIPESRQKRRLRKKEES